MTRFQRAVITGNTRPGYEPWPLFLAGFLLVILLPRLLYYDYRRKQLFLRRSARHAYRMNQQAADRVASSPPRHGKI